MTDIMPFEKFKKIMEIIQNFDNKKRKIGTFFESELMEDSWCIITLGNDIEEVLTDLLADAFDCHFTYANDTKSNDIEWWLYDAPSAVKTIGVDGEDIDITNLKDFYNYLVREKERKNERK